MNTARSIVEKLQQMSEQQGVVDAALWLQAALKLRVLLQTEQEKLVVMEQEVMKMKREFLEAGDTATAAKIKTESSDLFVETRKQEAFVKTALDVVLLAKKYATTESELYKAY